MMVHWILETQVLPQLHVSLKQVAEKRGHRVSEWNDDWSFRWPPFKGQYILFHGSLGVSNDVEQNSPWSPGAFCNLNAFHCSHYYPAVGNFLIHQSWQATTINELVGTPTQFFGGSNQLFVRPDSPLKPFSGRVISRDNVTLKALDHGFYYDEVDLPIILTPTQQVGQEWRFIVVGQRVITGSGYTADNRSGTDELTNGPAWELAETIAQSIQPPDPIYVLDIAESNGKLWLMELNPFSGADLYASNLDIVVEAVDEIASST